MTQETQLCSYIMVSCNHRDNSTSPGNNPTHEPVRCSLPRLGHMLVCSPTGMRPCQSNTVGIRPPSGPTPQLSEIRNWRKCQCQVWECLPSLFLYHQAQYHDLPQDPVHGMQPNYICLCYRSVFLFSVVGCSFPKSLLSAKIDLVVGSISGYRPDTSVLKGTLGF